MPRPQTTTRARGRTRAGRRRRHFAMRPASPVGGAPLTTVEEIKEERVAEVWQTDAYNYVDSVGEIGYALNLKASTIARCRLRVEVKVPGSDEWQATDDPRCRRVAEALVPPQGGTGELLRQAAIHWETSGEAWLYGEPVVDEYNQPAGLLWEFLSVLELEVGKDGAVKRNRSGPSRSGGRSNQDGALPANAYVARLHRRDAKYSQRADSPMRRVLPICRELVLLTQVIEAVAKSRLSAAMLYVPWEFSFGPTDEWENPGEEQEAFDELETELRRHLNAPIEDRSAPSSLMPLLMRGPAIIEKNGKAWPAKDLIGIINLTRELDGLYKELRAEALGRLASGLDIPPEIMQGKGGLNHWTGFSVDDDFVAKHIIPVGETICDFLTTAYFRPMLAVYERMTAQDAAWFRLTLDTGPITADADQSAPATTGMQLDMVSAQAWREANNFGEDAAPSDDELFQRTMLRLLLVQPTLGPAILPVLFPGQPGLQEAIKKWAVGQSAPGGAGLPSVQPVRSPSSGGGEPVPAGPRLADVSPRTLGVVLAAADRDLDRALERAANRLISRLNGHDRETADRLRAAKRTEVLTVAGPETARAVALGHDELFSGCWDDLTGRVAEWLQIDLVSRGDDPYSARQRATVAANELAQQLTHHAFTSLSRSITVGVNGFKVPDDLVLAALSAGDLRARS